MLVSIDKLTAGMQLAEDVLLPNGTTLLQSSALLNDHTIAILKKHTIAHVQIAENASAHNDSDPETAEHPGTQKPGLPIIRVKIEENGLTAFLRIEPTEGADEYVTAEDLAHALHENNVIFGIDEKRLDELANRFNAEHDVIESEHIAKGIPPTQGKEGQLNLLVEHITNQHDMDTVRTTTYCWELLNAAIPLQRVDPGTILAERGMIIPGIPGHNVLGEEISHPEIIKIEIKTGEHVTFDESEGTYTAAICGLTCFFDNTLSVLPVNFDGSCDVVVSPDSMRAELVIHPPTQNGKPPSLESIQTLLADNNITYGINNEALNTLVEKMASGVYADAPIIIAEGTPPVNGENGSVEYLFKTNTTLQPQEDEHGNVDFKHVSIIQFVKKDHKIAKLIPPTSGTPGTDIHGTALPSVEGTPALMPSGPNTVIDPENNNYLLAAIDGNVRTNGPLVEVFEGFVIKGDVDYSTGNIEYDKSVTIGGDVKAGFAVKCGGDLEVDGTIEDAQITVGGNVLCKYGFVGQGHGIIECNGDVNLTFMKNQIVRCRGHVTIAKEAINCTIFSRETVTVSGKTLSIAGGTVMARDGIICTVAGSETGPHTMLEAGTDFVLLEEIKKLEEQVAVMHTKRDGYENSFNKIDHIRKAKKQLPPQQQTIFVKLQKTLQMLNSQIKAIDERLSILLKKRDDFGNAFIKIEDTAYPGTVFKIGDRRHHVTERIIGPKIIRQAKGEIHVM